MLVYFLATRNVTDIWYILRPLGKFCDNLACCPVFGKLYREKSGNPAKVAYLID
jgi:hypothetical protein